MLPVTLVLAERPDSESNFSRDFALAPGALERIVALEHAHSARDQRVLAALKRRAPAPGALEDVGGRAAGGALEVRIRAKTT